MRRNYYANQELGISYWESGWVFETFYIIINLIVNEPDRNQIISPIGFNTSFRLQGKCVKENKLANGQF